MIQRIVLASASPRRLELCRQLDLDCVVWPVDIDETPQDSENAIDFVSRMAMEKAASCRPLLPEEVRELPILGSDTIVEQDDEILGKPVDAAHAQLMLSRLSGKTHRVHTAVALLYRNVMHHAVSSSEVSFADIDGAAIDRYIESGEPMDKAGAYAIQGKAARFVRKLSGSYSGVMGLPLYETSQLLAESGIEN